MASHSAPANSPPSSPEVTNIRRSVDTKRVRSPIKKVDSKAPNIYDPDNDWQVVHRRRRSKTSPSEPESPSKPESSSEAELHLSLDSDDEFPALGSPSPWISQHTSPRSRRSPSSSLSDPFLSGVDAAVKQR